MRKVFSLGLLVAFILAPFWAAAKDTPKAADTRKKLQQKISIEFMDTCLEDAMDEIKGQVKGLGVIYDKGISRNLTITLKADNKPLAEVLAGMFKKNGLGYVVISKAGTAYDGNLQVKQGPERGYAAGEGPAKEEKSETKAAKPKAGEKTRAKSPSATTSKEKDQPEDDAEKAEQDAARKLSLAKILAADGKKDKAKKWYEDIIAKFPNTKAAEEARKSLKQLDQ
jgi:hypothetical protein